MARVIVSNDWRVIKFSDKLKSELWWRKDLDDNNGLWRTDDEVIDAMIKLQGESFDELHNGVKIVEYDEEKCHPVIDEEEYGGENLHFAEGKGKVEWGYACSYNPITGECDENSLYNYAEDTYQVSESDIQGSMQLATKIISYYHGQKRIFLESLTKYSSCRLKDIMNAALLQTEEQFNTYLYIFACCSREFIHKDMIHIWAMMYTKERIKDMERKFRFLQNHVKTNVEPYMELLVRL